MGWVIAKEENENVVFQILIGGEKQCERDPYDPGLLRVTVC